jgi:hypothetical protein
MAALPAPQRAFAAVCSAGFMTPSEPAKSTVPLAKDWMPAPEPVPW